MGGRICGFRRRAGDLLVPSKSGRGSVCLACSSYSCGSQSRTIPYFFDSLKLFLSKRLP
jgi:hypothetical protein